jgi:hypothetical protein
MMDFIGTTICTAIFALAGAAGFLLLAKVLHFPFWIAALVGLPLGWGTMILALMLLIKKKGRR